MGVEGGGDLRNVDAEQEPRIPGPVTTGVRTASLRGCGRVPEGPLPGRKALLGTQPFISVIIYTPWSLEAENTRKLRGGRTTYLPQKDKQNQRALITITKLLTVVAVGRWAFGGGWKGVSFCIALSELFATFYNSENI